MRIRSPGCLLELILGGSRLAEAQILGDRAVEQVCVLRDDRYAVSDSAEGQVPQVMSSEPDGPCLGIVEPVHQPDERRLSCPTGPDYAKGLPFTKVE